MIFCVEYPSGEGLYATHITAVDHASAEALLKKRGLGEVVAGTGAALPATSVNSALYFYDRRQYKSCLHAVTYMCFVLVGAGLIDAADILSDSGVIHEVAHYIDNSTDDSFYAYHQVRAKILVVENLYQSITFCDEQPSRSICASQI